MKTLHLTTPIRAEDLEDVEIGDIIYLDGALITARDQAHHRLVKLGRELPVDLAGKAIFHAGPIMARDGEAASGWRCASIGPTTSMRMELFEKEFIERTGVRLIVGKGGMGPNTEAGCREHKAVHCVFPGGCAVVAAECVEEVEDLQWPELGMPESMWVMRVRNFGPLICSIDTKGRNLFRENKKTFEARKRPIVDRIVGLVDYQK